MGKFVICTDSACDLNTELLKSLGVEFVELTFRFDGEEGEYKNYAMSADEFYGRMKKGGTAKCCTAFCSSFIRTLYREE